MTTQTRVPTGDSPTSAANQFSPSTGTDKFAVVNDAVGTPDDAGYIFRQNSNGNQRFTFSPFTLPAGSSDITIRVTYRSKNQTGAVSYTPRILVGSTEAAGTTSTLTSAFVDRFTDWATNPVTGAAWTAADVNGTGSNPLTEFGVGQSGTAATEEGRVSQVYISATFTPPVTAGDTGAGADSASASATITGADTGAGAEGASVSASLTAPADAGASDDAASVTASLTGDDTGAGVDAASASALLEGADTAAGDDSAALSSAAVEASDLSVAGDDAQALASASADDAGVATDSASAGALAAAPDTASGVDGASVAVEGGEPPAPLVESYEADVQPVAPALSASVALFDGSPVAAVSTLSNAPALTVEEVARPLECEVENGF